MIGERHPLSSAMFPTSGPEDRVLMDMMHLQATGIIGGSKDQDSGQQKNRPLQPLGYLRRRIGAFLDWWDEVNYGPVQHDVYLPTEDLNEIHQYLDLARAAQMSHDGRGQAGLELMARSIVANSKLLGVMRIEGSIEGPRLAPTRRYERDFRIAQHPEWGEVGIHLTPRPPRS